MTRQAFDELVEHVQENVSWELGKGFPWECDCIIGAEFLAALVSLAAQAPSSKRREFLEGALVVTIG
jgi:hypothetical protein